MELGDEQSEEYARIAFLLGSSLRNCNPEQFLQLYDTVVPQEYTKEQLERLKESTREIASLSDGEFTELLSEPSKFTLVPSDKDPDVHASQALRCVKITTTTSSDSGVSSLLPSSSAMDLTGDEGGRKLGLDALARTSRHFTPKAPDSVIDIGEDDSGVFNSSKNTTFGEFDSEYTDQDPEAERVGYFDYFEPAEKKPSLVPQKKDSSNQELRVRNTLAYDAVIDADADPVTSDNVEHGDYEDCDWPGHYGASSYRAKKKFDDKLSNMTELTTFHRSGGSDSSDTYDEELVLSAREARVKELNRMVQNENSLQYDESYRVHSDNSAEHSHDSSLEEVVVDSDMKQNTSGDSSDEHMARQVQENVNIHQKLYSDSDYHYQPLSNYDDENKYCPSFSSHSSYSLRRSYEPDSKISFPLPSTNHVQYSRHTVTTRTSDTVKVEKSIKTKDTPPFGDPLDVKRFERSTERLIDFTRTRSLEAPNMPTATPISDTQALKEEEKKKKKRKKKKEAADKLDSSGQQQDENGNPVEEKSANPSSGPAVKKPLSSLSGSKSDFFNNTDLTGLPYGNEKSKFPSSMVSMDSLGFSHSSAMDFEDMSSQASREPTAQYAKMKAKKEKRQNKEKIIKAEEIPGYMGEKNIDQILSMIEGEQPDRNTNSLVNKRNKSVTVTPPFNDALIAQVIETNDLDSITEKDIANNKTKKKKRKSGEGGKDVSVKNHLSTQETEIAAGEKDSDGSSTGSEQPKELVYSSKVASNGLDEVSSINFTTTYKFTDFEEPPRVPEDEFVTVSKKKKPLLAKKEQYPYNVRDMQKEKYYPRKDVYLPRNLPSERVMPAEVSSVERDRGDRERIERVEKRPVRLANSEGTPPPTPTIDSQSGDGETERAFSPSQFPVLSAKPPSRVGRRNSTGNAPAVDVNYDSDMESVKSVPLVTGVRVSKEMDDSTSPGSNAGPVGISYASIAAGKKPNGPKASSSVSSGGSVPKLTPTTPPDLEASEHKANFMSETECSRTSEQGDVCEAEVPAILKESAPSAEGTPCNSEYNCEATFVLAQEDYETSAQPVMNGVNEINVSLNITLPLIGKPSFSAGGEAEPVPCQECEESVEYTYKLSETDPHVLEPIRPSHPSSHIARPDCNKCSHQISPESLPSPAPELCAPASQHPRSPAWQEVANSDISSSCDRQHNQVAQSASSQQQCDPSCAVTTKPTAGKSKHASKSAKSVIFLNEKMNQPTNLGISFGFDEEDMGDFPPLVNTLNNRKTQVPLSHTGQGEEFCVSFGGNGSMSSPPKAKHVVPPNGIIVPQGHPRITLLSNDTSNRSVLNPLQVSESQTGMVDNRQPLQKKCFEFLPPKDYKRENDPNFNCGSFDRESACYFLWTEWQAVQQLRNNGGAVLYSELS